VSIMRTMYARQAAEWIIIFVTIIVQPWLFGNYRREADCRGCLATFYVCCGEVLGEIL